MLEKRGGTHAHVDYSNRNICISTCMYFKKRYPGSTPKMKPLVVDKYNQYMLGVDRLDQRVSYYQFNRKSVRWWRKVFFWVLEVMIVNASILYLAHTDARRKLTRKEFRREIVLDCIVRRTPINSSSSSYT